MTYAAEHRDHCIRIASILNRIVTECEDFGARYQYSPRLMMAASAFAAIRMCDALNPYDRFQPFPPVSPYPGSTPQSTVGQSSPTRIPEPAAVKDSKSSNYSSHISNNELPAYNLQPFIS
jgi:hypothetical protein